LELRVLHPTNNFHKPMLPFIACLFFLSVNSQCDTYEAEKINEGYRPCVYYDTKGHPTIGVGCNLDRPNIDQLLSVIGVTKAQLLSGRCLDDNQIFTLFNNDMSVAKQCGPSWIPNWNSLSASARSAINDMSFNLGCAGLRQFVKLSACLRNVDYACARREMTDSLWCTQVGSRCTRDLQCMQ